MQSKHSEQTPDLRWFSCVMRGLKEGHRVLFHRSLVGVASVERSEVTVTREQQNFIKHTQTGKRVTARFFGQSSLIRLARRANVANPMRATVPEMTSSKMAALFPQTR